MNKREGRRNKAAHKVCRELRFQIATHGTIGEWDKLLKHLEAWLNNSKKDKYTRP